ncbi:Uncharacterised protein [Staphylococcus aureus]|nr:Uncharacterised protein [Staphylococcus aureus]
MRWRYLKILLTTVLSTAYNGTAIRTNVKPPKSPAAKITTIIVKGWILKDLPITFGVMILPSSWCAINVMIQTHINVVGLSIIPSIAAGANDNHEPKKGIKFATPANSTNKGIYGKSIIE